jgi:hypothetical protein
VADDAECVMTALNPYERLQDRCPVCLDTVNYPRTVLVDGQNARATYRCPDCRHNWFCSWSSLLYGEYSWTFAGDAA